MTECNTTTIDFTPLGRRQVVADFLGGRLSSDAGAVLLREVDRRIGLLPKDIAYHLSPLRSDGVIEVNRRMKYLG